MTEFCGSELWNLTNIWSDTDPGFSSCFEQTILVYVPCAFLWIFSLLELWYLRQSYLKNVPWSFWNISKLCCIAALIILSTIDLIMAGHYNQKEETSSLVYPVYFLTPSIKIVTFIYAGILVYLNKVQGQVCSGLLFLFWFLLTVFAIPQMRTVGMAMGDDTTANDAWTNYQQNSFIIFFSIICLTLLISCFSDSPPYESRNEEQANPNPEYHAGFLSRLTFSYYDRYAWMGYKRPLVEKDMWDLRYEDSAREITPKFRKHYDESIKKSHKTNRIAAAEQLNGYQNGFDKKSPMSADFKPESAATDAKTDKDKKDSATPTKDTVSVMPAIYKCFGATFFFGSILLFVYNLLIFVNPKILDRIIYFALVPSQPLWKGISYAVILLIITSIMTIIENQHFSRMFYVGMRIRTALVSAIYRKSLVLSNAARRKETVGEIVNLMAVDCQRFVEVTVYISLIWSAPLQIGLSLYFLWEYLGWSTMVGLATMLALLPFNGILAKKSQDLQVKQMKFKDERVKMMNEVLNGVKVLKLYAWEPSFEKRILEVRKKELTALRSAAYLGAGFSFIWTSAPFMVALASFASFVLSSPDNVLDPRTAFVSLSLFNILRAPFAMLPMMVTSLVQTIVSVRRINRFMNSEELDPDVVEHDPKETAPLVIENGTFRWDEESTTLKDINMRVEKNQLVAVVGSVGCGKSSLISAFLGDIEKVSGRINQLGSVAYVAQQAWIQNATLKDNILFGRQMDRKRYETVLDACALRPDLAMLPAGDLTEIGEKGINLSGGQKQRVSLARAVYQNAEVYYLDDPLSAVDSHVGKHIFEQVISNDGLLAGKTRVLVTHGITYLPKVDNIFVMSYGEITESGNYKELLAKKGAFAEFLVEHLKEASDETEDLAEIKAQIESEIGDADLRAKLQRAISASSERRDSTSSTGSTETIKDGSRQSLNVSSTDLRKRRKSSTKKEEEANQSDDKLIEDERAEIGGVKLEVYKYYIRNIGWGISILTLSMQILYQGMNVGSSLWLSEWSTDMTAVEPGRRNMYLTGYGLFGLGQATFSMIGALFFKTGAVAAAALIHAWLLNNILKCPMSFYDTTPLGRILARFSSDVAAVDTMIPILIELFFLMGLGVISTIIVICISTPWFMTVVIPISFFYIIVQRIYIATSRQLKRLESVSRSPIYSHFGETLTGSSTIRAYGAEKRFIETSDYRVDRNQVCYFPSIIANRWLTVRLEMIGNFITFFAALFAVLGRNSDSAINAGLVGLSVSYAMSVTQVLNWLVRMASDVETNIVAVERIKEYGESKQEAPWTLPNERTPKGWPNDGEVEFIDYQTRYREGLELVLQGVSFKVAGGEKVGIVGRTGAGKSSMTLGLFRIIEAAGGKIVIDGVDISQIGLHTLRTRLTIIPQDPVLFSGTLRINLDPGDIHTDDDIWEALENAHLKAFVKGLPSGLNHEISEGGENLSVGQRQLVCLARALLRKTKVLILDEATAAVDLETDDLIQKTIRTEFKECTVLTIAHRLNTILDSNKVLVLDKGHVAEFAPPDELLQDKNSIFYGMAKDAGLVS